MRQGCEAGVVQGRDQEPGRNAHRLRHVVVAEALALRIDPVLLRKDRNQHRRLLQEGLVGIGAQRRQRLQPLLRRPAAVERALLLLGRQADLPLELGPRDHRKVPGLLIGPRGGGAGRQQALLDDLTRHRPAVEVAHGAAPLLMGIVGLRTGQHLGRGQFLEAGQRLEEGRGVRAGGRHRAPRQGSCVATAARAAQPRAEGCTRARYGAVAEADLSQRLRDYEHRPGGAGDATLSAIWKQATADRRQRANAPRRRSQAPRGRNVLPAQPPGAKNRIDRSGSRRRARSVSLS
mmetsp:Transcript_986/g.1445  ORF Transcript_986/g.1445 Transcript_986/m.1445 type:complete len:291 (-) Transcript_986:880-1752(-)